MYWTMLMIQVNLQTEIRILTTTGGEANVFCKANKNRCCFFVQDKKIQVKFEKLLQDWHSFIRAEKKADLVPHRVQDLFQPWLEYYTNQQKHYQAITDAQCPFSCDKMWQKQCLLFYAQPWEVFFTTVESLGVPKTLLNWISNDSWLLGSTCESAPTLDSLKLNFFLANVTNINTTLI